MHISTPVTEFRTDVLFLLLISFVWVATVASAQNIYGVPNFVTPYGKQNYDSPPVIQPDLGPEPQTQFLNYQAYVRGQRDCAHFIYQVKRLANSVTQPNPRVWFNNGNVANNTLAKSLFNQNVSLRIAPIGVFPGFQLTVQYYYALPMYWFLIEQTVVDHMTCVGNVVSFRLTMMMKQPANSNTSQWSMIQFDREGKIKTLDALFYNLGAQYDNVEDLPGLGNVPMINKNTNESITYLDLDKAKNKTKEVHFPAGSYTYHLQDIYMLCQVTALGRSNFALNPTIIPGGTCSGANAIWNNSYGLSQFDYCMNWMQKEIPFGSWNWGTRNNTICRLIHTQLTYFYPTLHCPHVGFGGMFCKDYPYSNYFPPMVPDLGPNGQF